MAITIQDGKGPLVEADIAAAERELGVAFPADYRAFMARFNGGSPEPDAFDIQWRPGQPPAEEWTASTMSWFYWITEEQGNSLVRMNKVRFARRLPKGTLTVASDAGGNQILLALSGPHAGKVLFWVKDHEVERGDEPGYDNVGFLAEGFAEFVKKLR